MLFRSPFAVAFLVAATLCWIERRDRQEPANASVFEWLEGKSHDLRVRWDFQRDRPTKTAELAVVLIDDTTLAYMAQTFTNDSPRWPFSHFYHGILVRELKQQGASVVGFDVYFSQPDEQPRFPVKRSGTNLLVSGQQFLRAVCGRWAMWFWAQIGRAHV